MCVTICGRFCPDEGVVAGYDNRIRVKYTPKRGVQIAGMIFQTRSSTSRIFARILCNALSMDLGDLFKIPAIST
ncbi:DUF6783 domain-containing protein [Blautia sp. Sow4_E7]|uniref:DUF6783 domain-containing protein n=1 Tax=Blautia sp. Sow4_E7 TaxID=3438749 RepID=UPI003F92840F